MYTIIKEQIETPALLVDLDVLEKNIELMEAHLKGSKQRLRPHFKTHKSPYIAHLQINAGAKGITCAKLGEAEVLAAAGIKDILIANQVVDPCKIGRLAALANSTRLSVCVDNPHAISALSKAAIECGSTVYVLVEIDVGMDRCGVKTKEEALALAKQITDAEGLVFDGLQAYAGHLCHNPDREAREKGVANAEATVIEAKAFIESNGINVKEVSGSGTGIFDLPGAHEIWTEIQAGSYVFMDTDYNRLGLEFACSLSIMATIINKRPGIAITDAGLKVCCQEMGPPAIKDHPGLSVTSLSEEHGKIRDDNDELEYLQKIEYITSHCCATANLHDHYYCTRNGILEMVLPISGRGKSR